MTSQKDPNQKRVIIIRGEKHRLRSIEELRAGVLHYMERYHIKSGERIPQKRMSKSHDPRDRSLAYQLGIFGWSVDPRPEAKKSRNIGQALRELSFPTRKYNSYEDLAYFMRKVFPKEFIENLYETQASVSLRRRLFEHPEGKRHYLLLHSRNKDSRTRSLSSIVDSLYPDLTEKYGMPISQATHIHIQPQTITEKLRKWFYAGEQLTDSQYGLRSLQPDGAKVASAIRRNPLPGEFHIRKRTFTDKLCWYLKRAIPGVRRGDIISESNGALKKLGLIGERQFLFLLAAIKIADPTLHAMGADFRRYFPPPLLQVITPHNRDNVTLKSGRHFLEADGRVICDGRHFALEVKTYGKEYPAKVARMAEKYTHAETWLDGTSVAGKIAVLNILHTNGSYAELKNLKWDVLDRENFRRFYERGLEILLQYEPHFFERAAIPLVNPRALFTIDELVHERGHLLLRYGHRFMREWIADMLERNTACLLNGERFDRQHTYPHRHVTVLSELEKQYQLPTISRSFQGCLFLDLETASFRNGGAPIAILGMAYEDEGHMIVDQRLVRNPLEEADAVNAYEQRVRRATRLITFNGDSFDHGFISERARTHLIPQSDRKEILHLDLLSGWKNYAKKCNYPRYTLQDYERIFGTFKREDDLPGSKVPEVYHQFLYGQNTEQMKKIIHHNLLDILTLMHMYQDKRVFRM